VRKKDIDVVVAGHICLDMFPEFINTKKTSLEDLFIPGKLVNIGGMRICTGGTVSNTGIAMHILGARVSFMAKVGDDFIGETILNFLNSRVRAEGIKIVKGESSSYTIVIAPKNTDRIFLHNPGTNDSFCYDDIDFDVVKDAKLFHLGYPPLMKSLYENDGEELKKIYSRVKELGVMTSLDCALPDPNSPSGRVNWKMILKRVLPYVDIFLPSVEEAQFVLDKREFLKMRERTEGKELLHLFDGDGLTKLSYKLLDYGGKIVGLKCGSRGLYVRTASRKKLMNIGGINLDNWSERELWAPSYHAESFVSAAGAGDSAIAGFLVALLKGETIEMCLNYASMCGAQNVQALDTVSGLINWEMTTSKIESGWKRNDLKIRTAGWKFDAGKELWHGPGDRNNSCHGFTRKYTGKKM
jgi:sugar/nucleoside kinase (ribokinase family)